MKKAVSVKLAVTICSCQASAVKWTLWWKGGAADSRWHQVNTTPLFIDTINIAQYTCFIISYKVWYAAAEMLKATRSYPSTHIFYIVGYWSLWRKIYSFSATNRYATLYILLLKLQHVSPANLLLSGLLLCSFFFACGAAVWKKKKRRRQQMLLENYCYELL